VSIGDVEPEHLHLGEVGMANGRLVTSGLYGWTAVVTGVGRDVPEAQAAAYSRARRVHAPNMRYRLDIGDKLASRDLNLLTQLGWL
jgi:phosphoribosylamine--glycine ligase